MKLTTSIAYPFALIKPCGVQGDITLKDINQRIHAPPPSKSKNTNDEDTSMSYPTSTFSGKPVVVKTKIRTDGGKGSITIMRTKGWVDKFFSEHLILSWFCVISYGHREYWFVWHDPVLCWVLCLDLTRCSFSYSLFSFFLTFWAWCIQVTFCRCHVDVSLSFNDFGNLTHYMIRFFAICRFYSPFLSWLSDC